MSEVSNYPPAGNPLIGAFGYSRAKVPPGWLNHLERFIKIERELAPDTFLVAEVCPFSDRVYFRRICKLADLRNCRFYSSLRDMQAAFKFDHERNSREVMRRHRHHLAENFRQTSKAKVH